MILNIFDKHKDSFLSEKVILKMMIWDWNFLCLIDKFIFFYYNGWKNLPLRFAGICMKKGKSRLTFFVVLSCIVLCMGYFSVFGDRGILHLQKLKAELSTITAASDELNRKNAELKKEIQLLKNDPRYIEKIAREELGLARKDEMVYKRVKK